MNVRAALLLLSVWRTHPVSTPLEALTVLAMKDLRVMEKENAEVSLHRINNINCTLYSYKN